MLCQTFKTLAQDTWKRIGAGKTVSFQLKEETITDINLLELKTLHPKDIDVISFDKRTEGINGADWEWWFNDGRRWLGFRVQAKVIDIDSDRFKHLHYQGRASIPQSEKLILAAETQTTPTIPIYCLFINTDLINPKFSKFPHELYGCSVMSAYDVKRMRAGKENHISKLHPYIHPWHILVCPPGTGDPMEQLITVVTQNLLPEGNLNDPLQNFILDRPPLYIERFRRSTRDNINYEQIPDALAGIMVIDLEPQ